MCAADVQTLLDLAAVKPGPPRRRLLWFTVETAPWQDAYHDYLRVQARRLEAYGWSGDVLALAVPGLLAAHEVDLEDFTSVAPSRALSRARQNSTYVFAPDGARRLLARLSALALTETAVQSQLQSQSGDAADLAPVEAVRDGIEILKRWLAQVDEEHLGLLAIG